MPVANSVALPGPAARWLGATCTPLQAAVTFFLLAKLLWLLVPAAVMGLPRLGDDALVCLWSGASSVAQPRTDAPAIQDILRLRSQPTASADLDHSRARVTMRTTGVSASPVALATGALLALGLNDKVVFALIEALVALCLAVGVATCVTHVAGGGPAAGVLALLALALLPNQGLHYLVPSVLTLALGLLLWTVVLQQRRGWLPVLSLALLMLLVHPIGPVYVLVAAALIVGTALLQKRLSRTGGVQLGALAASWPLWQAILAATGARAPATTGLGGFSITAIPANFAGLLKHVQALATGEPVLALLLVIGLVAAVRRRRHNRDAFVLVGVLLGVVLSTVVVDLPGYPGELPSRALIALLIVASGVGIGWVLQRLGGFAHPRRWLALGLVLALGLQVPQFAGLAFGNINSRHQIYDSGQLAQEVAQLPAQAAVVWMDTDVALMAGLLAGADRVHAIPYPMVAPDAPLAAAIPRAAAVFVATSTPERLNGLASLGAWSLQPRFYGYDFDHYRRVSLYGSPGAALPAFVRLQGGNPAGAQVTAGERGCALLPLAAAEAHWFRIADCAFGDVLHIESRDPDLRLTGLSRKAPDPARPWPWGEDGLRLRAEPRAGGEAAELQFGWPYLFGPAVASRLRSELGPLTLVSSASGIIWLRAGAPARETP